MAKKCLKKMFLTWECTGRAKPLLSATIRVIMVFRIVPKNVFTPNARAHSSLVREEAIWKLTEEESKFSLLKLTG